MYSLDMVFLPTHPPFFVWFIFFLGITFLEVCHIHKIDIDRDSYFQVVMHIIEIMVVLEMQVIVLYDYAMEELLYAELFLQLVS